MKESTKIRLAGYKAKLKKHAPEIISVTLGVAGAIGWGLAGKYRREIMEMVKLDEDMRPFITVGADMMEEVRNGAILKYREAKFGDRKYFEQITVLDDFSEDENEAFEKFKETGEVDFDLLHGSVGGVTEKGGSEGE